MSHRPVCTKCQVEMRPEKNDVAAVHNDGKTDLEIWLCDLWKCPTCGYKVLSGFGLGSISSHYMESFPKFMETYKDDIYRYHQ